MIQETSPYPPPAFVEPLPEHFRYVGLTVDPPTRGPFPRRSARRDAVVETCRALLRELPRGVAGTVFRTVLMPPLPGVPRCDVLLLLRGTDRTALDSVPLPDAPVTFEMDARNVRRFGDTGFGEGADGAAYLFNHFTAPDTDSAVAGWEEVSGWYFQELGVDNSTLLRPDDDAPYAIVNHARLPVGPVRFLFGQLLRPAFHRFVRPALERRQMVALPLIARPA